MMNRPLLFFIFFLVSQISIAQDPLNEIDPSRKNPVNNTERPSMQRTEIPGTIRETSDDRTVRTLEEQNPAETETGDAPRDTTSIKFVDENGRIINNPSDYVRTNLDDRSPQRKSADTLEYFQRQSNPALNDTVVSKP